MNKPLLASLCLAGFLAGALIACGYANAEEAPPAPIDPGEGETVEPPHMEPDREKCDAWIAYMVDGRLARGPAVVVPMSALMQISMTCLGRLPHPLERSPHPHKMGEDEAASTPPPPAEPPAPAEPERITL